MKTLVGSARNLMAFQGIDPSQPLVPMVEVILIEVEPDYGFNDDNQIVKGTTVAHQRFTSDIEGLRNLAKRLLSYADEAEGMDGRVVDATAPHPMHAAPEPEKPHEEVFPIGSIVTWRCAQDDVVYSGTLTQEYRRPADIRVTIKPEPAYCEKFRINREIGTVGISTGRIIAVTDTGNQGAKTT